MKAIEGYILFNKAAIIAECKKNGWTGKEVQNFNGAIDGLFQDLKNFEKASQEGINTSPMQDQFNENVTSLLTFMTTPAH